MNAIDRTTTREATPPDNDVEYAWRFGVPKYSGNDDKYGVIDYEVKKFLTGCGFRLSYAPVQRVISNSNRFFVVKLYGGAKIGVRWDDAGECWQIVDVSCLV